MHNTHIDLSLDIRQDMIQLLNARLADAIDLGLQVKMAHWNVRGPHFIGLHKLFDEFAPLVHEYADLLAERLAQLGGVARGNLQEVAKATSLGVFDSDISKDTDIIGALTQGIAGFTNNARKAIDQAVQKGDAITADLLTGIVREADKYLWFVEAHLQ